MYLVHVMKAQIIASLLCWEIFCLETLGSLERNFLLSNGLASNHCDLVYFLRAKGSHLEHPLVDAQVEGSRAVLVTSTRPDRYSRPPSARVGCQQVFLVTNGTIGDLIQVGRFIWRYRLASSVVIRTTTVSPQLLGFVKKRHTFDLTVYTASKLDSGEQGNFISYYLSNKDPRWRFINATYLVLSPYVFPPQNGKLDGTDVVIWDILSKKHKLTIHFTQSKNFNELYSRVNNLKK